MSDAFALVAAIRAAPEDDAPRLIFADWLDENGWPARAEFIRVQCKLARKESPTLRRREVELLAAHYATFAHPLSSPEFQVRFYRGFAVGFGHTGFFVHTRIQDGVPVNYLLRFHPQRTVLGVSTTQSPELAARSVGRARPYAMVGTYALDPFVLPTRVWFRCSTAEETIALVGALVPPTLDVYHRGRRKEGSAPTCYMHVPILGFASFSES